MERKYTEEEQPVKDPPKPKIKVLNGFCSEKKIGHAPLAMQSTPSSKPASKPMFLPTGLHREPSKRTEISCSEINWQPSESTMGSVNKIHRARPKSSIMSKDRHESTMKNIKKHARRDR